MRTVIVFALPMLASAAFAFENLGVIAKDKMNCSGTICCGRTGRAAEAKIPRETANPEAEAWFRMKYGRNTPAEEARQKIARQEIRMMNCTSAGRVRKADDNALPAEMPRFTADPMAEDRFRMKYGRNTPAEEASQKKAREMNSSNTEVKPVMAATLATADPAAEDRFRMKYGRNTPAEERRRAARSANPDRMLTGSADRTSCNCIHGQ